MSNRIKSAALALLMITVLFGCSKKRVDTDATTLSDVEQTTQYALSETLPESEITEDSTHDELLEQEMQAVSVASETAAATKQTTATTTQKTTAAAAAVKATTTADKATTTVKAITTLKTETTSKETTVRETTSQKTTSAAATTSPAIIGGGFVVVTTATTTVPTTAAAGKASVRIECMNAVNDGIRDKDGHGSLPANGEILNTSVEIESGDTAGALVSRAAADAGIDIVISGGYIKSIAGLKEKDCGGSSGWLYSVNGVSPMTSISSYKPVKDGDVITLHYTVKPGDIEGITWG